MSLLPFLAFSTAGSLAWCSLLTGAGSMLEENYQKVSTYLDPVSKGILILIVAAYLFRLMTYRPEKSK